MVSARKLKKKKQMGPILGVKAGLTEEETC